MKRDFEELVTEKRSRGSDNYTALPTQELVALMNSEDAAVPAAVGAAAGDIASAVDAIVERLTAGGRLIYVGAGTSGGLAALDASECEATFSTEPGRVTALVAGAGLGSVLERTAAEDDAEAGEKALRELGVTNEDAVVGVSASGRTPYALGALRAAGKAGALTVALVCADDSPLAGLATHSIVIVVGPEFIAGSTRLKAGTAQKLVLNMISTISMIRLGKTYGNLMVEVLPANEKLRARATRIVRDATDATPEQAEQALQAADGNAKVAIVSLLAGLDAEEARARLAAADDDIRAAVSE